MARKAKDDVIELAMKRWKMAVDAEEADGLRQKELDDLKFSMGTEDQWPAAIFSQRTTDSRPSLVDDRLNPAIRQVTNDQRQNRPSLKFIAQSDATERDAEIWEGLARSIQADSLAEVAFDTATDFQVRSGRGYFRVNSEYEDDTSFDQVLKIEPIYNPFTIYDDPTAIRYDRMDRNFLFITSDIPKDEYKDYAQKYEGGNSALMSIGDQKNEWINDDFIRVAEYWEVVEEPTTVYQIKTFALDPNTQQLAATVSVVDDKAKIPEGAQVINERESKKRVVKWRIINGYEVLEEKEWPGKYIPIIPVFGEQYDVDGKRVIKGMVRNAKDPQRMVNYWTSALTEAIALAPKSPVVGAVGQFESKSGEWKQANVKNFAYLEYDPIDVNGNVLPPPQRNAVEPPIQAMTMALRQAIDSVKAVTGIYDPSLGGGNQDQSGRAIIARQKEGDTSNLHYQDNLGRSIHCLGVILEDLIPHYYDGARAVQIAHADGSTETVQLNQPHMDDDGQPAMFDMSKGKFNVTVDVGPSYTTRRQEALAGMIALIQTLPQAGPLIADMIARAADWPEAQEVADRLKLMLPPQLQKQANGQPSDPQKDQMGEMIQKLSQQLHALQDQLDSNAADNASREKIASINADAGVVKQIIASTNDADQAFAMRRLDMIDKQVDFLHADHSQLQGAAIQQSNAAQQAAMPPQQPPQTPP